MKSTPLAPVAVISAASSRSGGAAARFFFVLPCSWDLGVVVAERGGGVVYRMSVFGL